MTRLASSSLAVFVLIAVRLSTIYGSIVTDPLTLSSHHPTPSSSSSSVFVTPRSNDNNNDNNDNNNNKFSRRNTTPFPSIPDSFIAELEVNDRSHSHTTRLWELYDFSANRLRISLGYADGHSIDVYVDENERTIATVKNATKCELEKIPDEVDAEKDGSAIGTIVDMHGHHIKHVKDMLHAGAKGDNVTYIGIESVRGIDCDVWSVTYSSNEEIHGASLTATMRHAFAIESWEFKNDENEHRIPIETTWNGKVTNLTTSEVEDFELTYSWVNFIQKTPDSHMLAIPALCHASTGGDDGGERSVLPTIPDNFFTVIEANLEERSYSVSISEWHDFANNRLRFSHVSPQGARDDIYRIDLGKHFRVETDSDGKATCDTSDIDANGRFIEGGGVASAQPHLKHTRDMFGLSKPEDYDYLGATRVRGIAAVHWSTAVSHPSSRGKMSYTIKWFFEDSAWKSSRDSEPVKPSERIPLRATIEGHETMTNGTVRRIAHNYEFVEFVPGETTDRSVFAIPVACGGDDGKDSIGDGGDSNSGGGTKSNEGGGHSSGKVAAAVLVTLIFTLSATASIAYYLHKRVLKSVSTPIQSMGGPQDHTLTERVDGGQI